MRGADPETVAWVSSHILPFEAELRLKVRRFCRSAEEVDDLVQDVYFRLLKLTRTDHISDPRGYLFQMARNIIIDQARRDRIVRFEAIQDLEELAADGGPTPEAATMARAELKWVLGVIANLPERCRQVFRLRKIYGFSQAETARDLNISENIVEKETMNGMRLIADMVARVGVTEYGAAQRDGSLPSRGATANTHVKD